MGGSNLPTLKAGEFGTIESIDGTHTAAKRLADMGFVRGAHVTMIRPGEPCIVRIDGRCVGLGGAHQNSILLTTA
jgi:Fe2+ transport system protein FeoA